MDWYDFVIVGSGPAGVAAARRFIGTNVCIIDVGEVEKHTFPQESLNDVIQSCNAKVLLGSKFEMLANILQANKLHPKVRSANLDYVLSGEPFSVITDNDSTALDSCNSWAKGGMSNIWGGQLLRYTQQDLDSVGDWPINSSQLNDYYNDLENHIGFSGEVDDMQNFLGNSIPLMPPPPMVTASQVLYKNYLNLKKSGICPKLLLGHPRLALSTIATDKRVAYRFNETEFFTSNQPGLYTARYTLDELIINKKLEYISGHKVIDWNESPDFVELKILDTKDNSIRSIRCKHLLLGCGAMQTAKLVLQHFKDFDRSLPFIDHPPTLLPIFIPRAFGSILPTTSYPIQLIATMPYTGRLDMVSFYYPGGMLWSDLIPDIPIPFSNSLRILRKLLGGMLVAQIWQATHSHSSRRLSLDKNKKIIITYKDNVRSTVVSDFVRSIRELGCYSIGSLATTPQPGWGFHYAGCLPMRESPEAYETHVDGRLWNSKRVRIIDASVLPSLPAKNHSLTLMANSARIADEVLNCVY